MPKSLYLCPVSDDECMSIISKLKISKCGHTVLPTKILIEVKHLLAEPISFLFNESFACGVFPDILKSAVIRPIFKKDDPLIVSNYRPISALHWLSKIFEISISKRIISFANEMSLFSSCQFGFRS